MNGFWFVFFSAALFSIFSYVIYHHYGKIGLFAFLAWTLPGFVYLSMVFLSLESTARVYAKFIGLVQTNALIAFIVWFRTHYNLNISIEPKFPVGKTGSK